MEVTLHIVAYPREKEKQCVKKNYTSIDIFISDLCIKSNTFTSNVLVC